MKHIIAIAVLLLAGWWAITYYTNHTEQYQVVGTCIDKFITPSHGGESTNYHVIIKYEDGETADLSGWNDTDLYYRYSVGDKYTFTFQRFKP